MPFRHFYLLSHYICNGLFVLFSVCWLHVNEFNSLCGDKGGEVRSLLLAPKLSLSGIFIVLFPHYSCYGLLFLLTTILQRYIILLKRDILEYTINVKAISLILGKMTIPFLCTAR